MLLGIDVGGTFTDAVVIKDEEILAQAKVPTTHEDVLQGILAALDKVLLDGVAPNFEQHLLVTPYPTPPKYLAKHLRE